MLGNLFIPIVAMYIVLNVGVAYLAYVAGGDGLKAVKRMNMALINGVRSFIGGILIRLGVLISGKKKKQKKKKP